MGCVLLQASDSCRVAPWCIYHLSTLDVTNWPLQIIWTLCQYVINRTRHQFTAGDRVTSCWAISSVQVHLKKMEYHKKGQYFWSLISKSETHILYRFITQSEIFQDLISWIFDDYGLQIMKTQNSVCGHPCCFCSFSYPISSFQSTLDLICFDTELLEQPPLSVMTLCDSLCGGCQWSSSGPLPSLTLHVMNLKYIKVSLFEISYKKKKSTFSPISFFFFFTCRHRHSL